MRALQVESDADGQRLVAQFTTPQGGLVGADGVVPALTAFVRVQREEKEKEEKGAEMKESTEKGKGKEEEEGVQEFWERIAGVVPEATVAVWDRLEMEMTKYNKLLKERYVSLLDIFQIRDGLLNVSVIF